MDLYEKTAFFMTAARAAAKAVAPAAAREVGAVAGAAAKPGIMRSLGSGALNFGKGLLFADHTAGAGVGGKIMNGAGKALAVGGPIASSMGVSNASAGPSASVAGMEFKMGSVDTRLYQLAKTALTVGDAIDIASYGAMIGSKLAPKTSPWHTGLEAAGLLGLAGTTGHSMLKDPSEHKPGVKDLIGLALFASALRDRHLNHSH